MCMRERNTQTEIYIKRVCQELFMTLCGYNAYGSFLTMCVGFFGGNLWCASVFDEYLCVGGHPFTTGDSGMMRDSQGPRDPRIQRLLTLLPPGVCVRERHQHLYVCSIPMCCVCGHVRIVECQQAEIITSTRGRHWHLSCPDFLDLYFYTERKKERKNLKNE